MSDLPDNVVKLFWWKYLRDPVIPPPPELTTDQKIALAFRKQWERLNNQGNS